MSSELPPWQPWVLESGDLPQGLSRPLAGTKPGTLLVLVATPGAEAGDWAPRASAAFASCWGGRGERVFLVDLGLENPRVHDVLDQVNAEGIVDACLYGASLRRVAVPVAGRAFFLVPAGTFTADSESVLRHERWDALVRVLAREHAVMLAYVPATVPGLAAFLERASQIVLLANRDEEIGGRVLAAAAGRVRAVLGPPRGEAPVAAPTEARDREVAPGPGATPPEPTRRRRRDAGWTIIIAEDEEDHAVLIRTALERVSRRPIELTWVRDGDAALEAVQRHTPDLLLLDLHMPGRSGHEVLAHLKADERLRRIPVAVLTSSGQDEDIARSYGLGANHFIAKPKNPAQLEQRLQSLLDGLPELGRVRRGVGRISATASSDVRPPLLSVRGEYVLGAVLAVVAAFLAYLIFAGR